MWKRTRFLLLILPLIFLCLQFSNIKKKSSFRDWESYKVETWSSIFFLSNSKTLNFCHTFLWVLQSGIFIHIWENGWSIVYIKYQQPEYTCSFIFLVFLSLQLGKIKNLHLQNCFNLPLMATAGCMWALLTLFTCSSRNGCSVIVYFILSEWSDHGPLTFNLLCHTAPVLTDMSQCTTKIKWGDSLRDEFRRSLISRLTDLNANVNHIDISDRNSIKTCVEKFSGF